MMLPQNLYDAVDRPQDGRYPTMTLCDVQVSMADLIPCCNWPSGCPSHQGQGFAMVTDSWTGWTLQTHLWSMMVNSGY